MAKQIISGNLNALKALIEPFGWMLDKDAVERCSASTLKTLQDWCEDEDSEEDPCPGSLWNVVYVPYDQRKAFKNENDVRAVLFELLAYRADFLELAKNPDGWLRVLADNMSHGDGGSKFGTVFFDDHEGEMAIWFGAKENMLPWMAGENLRAAMQTLLKPISVPTVPTPANSELGFASDKKANRVAMKAAARQLATPPPAASVSGPKSGKMKMVATKFPAPLIAKPKQSLEFIDIDCIESDPANDRKNFDKAELQQLADSIAKHGILQPINLRPIVGRNAFMIVAGERRWRAAKLAGLREIPAQIGERDGIQVSLARLDENLKRVDLSPIEKAQAMKRIMDEHQLTQKELGEAVGVEQGQVSNMLRLLNLPEKLHSKIGDGEGQIAATTIRPALPFADVPAVVEAIEQMINDGGPYTSKDVECYLETAIHKGGRSMRYNEQRSKYSKPQKTERHFKELSAADRAELQIRKYDGEEFAFNIAKFDELNREPLKKRLDAFKKATAVSNSPAKPKDKTAKLFGEYKEHQLQSLIRKQLSMELEQVIIDSKDAAAVGRSIWALALLGDLRDVCGNLYDKPAKYFEAMTDVLTDPKQTVAKIVAKLRGTLRNCQISLESLHYLAGLFNVRLGSDFRPLVTMLELLTDEGLEVCRVAIACEATQKGKPLIARLVKEWPAGTIPPFLEALFEYPKAPAKKKSKAA